MLPELPPHTIDAFHRGRFWLVQPAETGHRAGMDALILAAAVPSAFSGQVADFGAGAGAAGMAVASRCPSAFVTLVESDATMAEFARATLATPANTELAGRVAVLAADVTLSGQARNAAGLGDNQFDFAIMNPPFNLPLDRASPDAMRRSAHVMQPEMFEQWIRSAAAAVRPKGAVAIIARPVSLPQIITAMDGRFGDAEIVPIHARADRTAIRVVVRARRASRGGLSVCPALVLRDLANRGSTQRAKEISEGVAALFGD
jgi:tRNA1(Val) A37 N6-methylase TrmN6